MSGYVPNPPKGYRYSGVEPVDIHAQRWTEYKDVSPKVERSPNPVGCVFAKSCELSDGVINYQKPAGFIPVEKIANYGEYAILGGRDVDEDGNLPLKKISGSALPSALGTLILSGTTATSAFCGGICTAGAASTAGAAATGAGAAGSGAITAGVAVGSLGGIALMLWSSNLGDSSLYSEEQLRSLEQARTRVRLHVEQQADGALKGYGFNTQKHGEWEMIPVVQFVAEGSKQVADFGNGLTLIWTPAVDPSSSTGIPPLEAAPQAPQIWIYPPTEQADNIIVSPIYPDQYLDFILVFPAGSGIQPLYIVVSARHESGTVTGTGRDIFGTWLDGAGTGLGSPIPTRIADQLRGQNFKSFDDFRAALWIAVGKDAELLSQFKPTNQDWILKGNSPFAPKAERNGGKGRYEIHHIEHIQHGGAVYDVDNLTITTPKRHAEIHKEDRNKS